MTTLENLRTRKLQLEQHLAQGLSEEQREHIKAELTEIEIALSSGSVRTHQQATRRKSRRWVESAKTLRV